MTPFSLPLSRVPTAVCEGGRRLRDDAGRLLRGVGGLRCDWLSLVAVAGEEDEEAAGGEPGGVEVQRQPPVNTSPPPSPPTMSSSSGDMELLTGDTDASLWRQNGRPLGATSSNHRFAHTPLQTVRRGQSAPSLPCYISPT